MSKKYVKKYQFKSFESKSPNPSHYARITDNMVKSPAWKALSGQSVNVYLLLKMKFTGGNEQDISLTYKEAHEYMNQRTFTRAIDDLIEHGFVKIVRQAWTSRECNIYGFSDAWQYFGTPQFKFAPRVKRRPESTGRLKRATSEPLSLVNI